MSIVFTIIRDKRNNEVLCKSTSSYCYSDYTHGTETDTTWEKVEHIINDYNSSMSIVLFESAERARLYITHYLGEELLETYEVLSFAEIDAITESILLGKDGE